MSYSQGSASAQGIVNQRGEVIIPDPPLAHALFGSTRFAWLWLILRLYLGWQWLSSGWGKISGGTWASGESLKGFWTNAVAIPEQGKPPIAFDWYRDFIQFMLDRGWYTWFADVIMWGEFLIGIALILGAFVGIAAFCGAFLNWNFIMAGTASTNGLLFAIAIVLMLAWKVAGWYGLDRWLLPLIGTPWYRDTVTKASPGRTEPG
jgi:thiosulfate dehydrogenase [quinone] large subunit